MTPAPLDARYGFGGRLTEAFPSQVIMDLTEVCNLACIHCPHPDFKRSVHYDARYMDPALNAKMVDEVREHGAGLTQYIRYTSNGEPLIHPRGYDMIEYAVKHSGTFVTLTTNGTIMNEKRTRRLLEAGVHMIDISIDAFTNATYAAVRVNGDLDVTRENVLRLLRWKREAGSPAKVVVSFVEQPQNATEVAAFKSYWEGEGADYVVVRRLHSAAGAVVDASRILKEKHRATHRRPCAYPWERVMLTPQGELAFCPVDWSHGSALVDFRTTTVKETWSGPLYQALRRAHLENSFANHSFCGQCPDWAEVLWPHEGRAYADLVAEFRAEDAP